MHRNVSLRRRKKRREDARLNGVAVVTARTVVGTAAYACLLWLAPSLPNTSAADNKTASTATRNHLNVTGLREPDLPIGLLKITVHV